jgi:hypothetical protein
MLRRSLLIACALVAAVILCAPAQAQVKSTPLLQRVDRQLNAIDRAVTIATISGPRACIISQAAAWQMMTEGERTLDQLWQGYRAASASGNDLAAAAYLEAGEELDAALDDLYDACWPVYSATAVGSPLSAIMLTAMWEFGIGSSGFDWQASSSQPAAASGNNGITPNTSGVDIRAAWMMYNYLALTGGFSATWYYAAAAQGLFDLDPFSPGLDTVVRAELARTYALYAGLTWFWPTYSAVQAGIAGQRGAGTFATTLYMGAAFAQFLGTVTTNEAGVIRSTPFDQSVTGLRVGFDVDYPLWIAGFETLRAAALRPMLRAGVSADFYPSFSIAHQALFNTYLATVSPETVLRFYLGIGFQINPQFGLVEAR